VHAETARRQARRTPSSGPPRGPAQCASKTTPHHLASLRVMSRQSLRQRCIRHRRPRHRRPSGREGAVASHSWDTIGAGSNALRSLPRRKAAWGSSFRRYVPDDSRTAFYTSFESARVPAKQALHCTAVSWGHMDPRPHFLDLDPAHQHNIREKEPRFLM
jgi:hypothetical protein